MDAPIFHVNGDNVEAVNFVCQLAAHYRAKYKRDVVIDIVCYRRYGHNETDQPHFTQPRMYQAIEKQPTPLTQYTKFLLGRGTFTEKDIEEHKKWVWGMLEKAAAAAKDYVPTSKEWLSASWQNGAWTYVGPRILTAANETQYHKGKYPLYAGRQPTSSVATGSKAQHKKEIEEFLSDAFRS